MQISLEKAEKHAIQAYSETKVKVNDTFYERSLIISQEKILASWPILTIIDFDEQSAAPLVELKPEIIIIGHDKPGLHPPLAIFELFSKLGIGFECMSLGAACRTFNVLLSEQRSVAAGLILCNKHSIL